VCAAGDWRFDVPPSPYVHAQLVGAPVDVLVTLTANGTDPLDGERVKAATGAVGTTGVGVGTGAALTVTVWVAVLVPFALATVNVIVYVPAEA
jgi:hypothetical protein